ncbi:MAG: phosphatase PAP2 family protein [Patescibacteria group bacterium]
MTLLEIDQNLTNILYELTRTDPKLQGIVYLIATYLIFLLPVVLVWLAYKPMWRNVSLKIFLFTIITWQLISKNAGEFFYNQYNFRDRPFAFSGLKELLFEQPQKSFPSDHSAVLLFVTLALFHYRQRTWAWIFLVVTVLSGLSRVSVGFHWIGDVIGGWIVALIGFGLLVVLEKPLEKMLDLGVKFFKTTKK